VPHAQGKVSLAAHFTNEGSEYKETPHEERPPELLRANTEGNIFFFKIPFWWQGYRGMLISEIPSESAQENEVCSY
jgi:hypothetical protein